MRRFDDLIFDIGMNICEDTDFYLKKGFRVIGVDANPVVCRAAGERYREAVAENRLIIVNRAIAATEGTVRFYVCNNNSAWSTASPRLRAFWEARGADFTTIDVQTLSPVELVIRYGVPHYAKIDIEGSDMLCLRAFADSSLPEYLSIEVDFHRHRELLKELRGIGYRRFALIGQLGVREQRPPLPAREGCYVDYRFEIGPDGGSSGLFGRELPAAWVDEAAIARRCRRIIRHYRVSTAVGKLAAFGIRPPWLARVRDKYFPLAGDWYDLHAAA
jgi:FkbM family methyltransferase